MFYVIPYLILNLLALGRVAYFVFIENNTKREQILTRQEYLKSEEFLESQKIAYVVSLKDGSQEKPKDQSTMIEVPQGVSIVQDQLLLDKLRDAIKREFFLPKGFDHDAKSVFRVVFSGDSIEIHETEKSANEELRRLAMRAVRSACNESYKDFAGCQIDICFVCIDGSFDVIVSDAWVNTVQER